MNFSAFDLNLLRVFDALLRERSTTRAGQRIGLSQPAVSAALGRLRTALGDEVFVRRGQGLEPTAYALDVAADLHSLMEQLEALLHAPGFDAANATDTFRMAGIDFFAEMLMPRLAQLTADRAPGVTFQLVDLVPGKYAGMMDSHAIDLVLVPDMEMPDWVDSAPLFHSPFVVIARAGHPRFTAEGIGPDDPIPLELFCELGHVLCSPDGKLKAQTDRVLAERGLSRRVVMSMPYFSGVTRVVADSDHLAMVPAQLADILADRLRLTRHPSPVPMPVPLIRMFWPRRMSASPAHAWLRDTVSEVLTPLDPGLI
ncbi:LysR family transcriptional regulator [Pseudaestuariivita atlantica]|uniref:LysR family transcriptional regulator n=1 Tax=Pseudaestuariivita atlantica TaxID=1317121 RepID=A0A0L1JQN3_9RHOB|nr:LysR family transcriptional regulator [Pseudaestuariivita atlantica]KNG94046.1 LysR family transcriptional regulator [Pseudaestuariivita atlantica]